MSNGLPVMEAVAPSLQVVTLPNPFSVERREAIVKQGGTVAALLLEHLGMSADELALANVQVMLIDPSFTRQAVVSRDLWHLTKPKAGTTLSVRVIPTFGGGGGKKSPLRLILTLAVIAASIWAGGSGFLASLGGQFSLFGSTMYAGQILGAAVIGMPGGVVMNVGQP